MSNADGFAIDHPVSSLDDPDLEDSFVNEYGEIRPIFDEDNTSLKFDDLDEQTITDKLKNSVASLFKFGKKKQFNYLGDTIELFDRNRSQSSFTDDFDIDTQQFEFDDNGDYTSQRKKHKKYVTYVTLGLLFFTLVLIAFIFQVKSSLPSSNPSATSTEKEEQNDNSFSGEDEKGNSDKGISTSSHMNGVPKTLLSNGTHDFYPTTILISLDGFHPHYISPELTPLLHNLMIGSYGAPYMIPSFPSSTFPNHWTLVTGLYPNDHGIVGNTFYDPVTESQYVNVSPELSLKPEWWGGEPVWRTAYYQNISTGIHMWPGSEVVFPDGNPMEVDKYNGTELLSVKVDRLLSWLDRDIESRPELMLSYVPTVDSLGHKYGVEGEELQKGLTYVDNFLDALFLGIYERNLTDLVNVIIVSDHGMAPTSNDRLIYLNDLVDDLSKVEHMDGWPLFGLRPTANVSVDQLYNEIMNNYEINDMKDHFKVYLREELPEEWKFGSKKFENQYTSRIAPIWIIPDVGYSITTYEDMARVDGDYTPHGVHGYNNTELLMRAIFIGSGPYFHKQLGTSHIKLKPFENVEVYNIVCDSLSIVPAASNSTIKKGQGSYVNTMNVLSEEWVDELTYPDVAFPLEIIHKNATYDMLYREKLDHEEVVKPFDPTTTASSSTSTSLSSSSASSSSSSTTVESISSSTKTTEVTSTPTTSESTETLPSSDSDKIVKGGSKTSSDEDDEDENDDDDDHHGHDNEDKDDKKKAEDGKTKSKGKFFEEIEGLYNELEDFVDDTIDDIEDMLDSAKKKTHHGSDDD